MPLNLTLTAAGIAEIVNAVNTGTDPVLISEIALGDGQYTPDGTETDLVNEVARINTIAGIAVADDTLHVMIKDESADTYSVGEIGLYTDGGTLLGIVAQDSVEGWIVEKASPAVLLIAADIILTTISANSLSFGDVNFINPQATETVKGVAEIATQGETDAGTDDQRFVTPLKLKNWIKQATESVLGMLKVATQAQVNAGVDDKTAITPLKLKAGSSVSIGSTGYLILPSWLGGLVFQWAAQTSTGTSGTITFPIAFPTACFGVIGKDNIASLALYENVTIGAYSDGTQFSWESTGSLNDWTWFAIGY